MQRFKNILFLATGDHRQQAALEQAVSLARENQAGLTVVDVVELPGDLSVIGRDKRETLISEMVNRRMIQLDDMVQDFRTGVGIQTRVIQGKPFLAIIREVLRNNYDLVMKLAEGGTGLKNLLFGSIDMHLLRKCPCPVWIMKSEAPVQYKRVLAAVDMEPEGGGQQTNALNKQILEMASSLALSEFSEMHIIHAWTGNGYTILDGIGADLNDQEMEKWGRKIEYLHREWLEKQQQQLASTLENESMEYLSPQLHLVEGETCEVITDFVEKKKIDIVVMGTVARTGIAGFFMGNTAEAILNNINCSVLAVKPPGFVTPVTLADEVKMDLENG